MKHGTNEQQNFGHKTLVFWIAAVVLLALVGSVRGVSANPKPTAGPSKVADLGQSSREGWKIPRPPYPAAARVHHEEGVVYVVMTTDDKGRIAKISIPRSPKSAESKALRDNTLSYAKYNWSGPPNTTVTTSASYRLR